MAAERPMTRLSVPSRYFLASILLLSALVGLLALAAARRTQQELARQLEDQGLSLADALAASSRSAIAGHALMEELIAQRLLDNARLVDQLLRFRPPDAAWLRELSAANRLARVDLLDAEGKPYAVPPPRPPMMMGMGMMGRPRPPGERPGEPPSGEPAEPHRGMAMFMWGRRWGPTPPAEEAPPAIRDRTFWKGSLFGVAVGARSFPGIIAVHADADFVLAFTREAGVQRQVEELGRQPGIEAVALLDRDLVAVAHSRAERVGQREADPALGQALAGGRTLARFAEAPGGRRVWEVARPLQLGDGRAGLLRIALSTEALDRAWRRDRLAAAGIAGAVLLLGMLGTAAIFYTQHRHLVRVRALESEMARRERLAGLGDMAASVAHEVRNPLNAVSVGLQRLRAEFEPAEAAEYRRLLDVVQAEVRRLDGIVEEFLALARPLTLDRRPVPLGELVEETLVLLEPQAQRAGVTVARRLAPGLPAVEADRDRLAQVLTNLLLNALQAMPGGGTLTLGARADRRTLTLEVADTGPGIPPEVLPRIFEPYVTTKARGLGLGLPIARRIVEAHGGRIEAESEPGRGARFRVALPLAAPAAGAGATPAPVPAGIREGAGRG
jgi:signal transduction histidine kinase